MGRNRHRSRQYRNTPVDYKGRNFHNSATHIVNRRSRYHDRNNIGNNYKYFNSIGASSDQMNNEHSVNNQMIHSSSYNNITVTPFSNDNIPLNYNNSQNNLHNINNCLISDSKNLKPPYNDILRPNFSHVTPDVEVQEKVFPERFCNDFFEMKPQYNMYRKNTNFELPIYQNYNSFDHDRPIRNELVLNKNIEESSSSQCIRIEENKDIEERFGCSSRSLDYNILNTPMNEYLKDTHSMGDLEEEEDLRIHILRLKEEKIERRIRQIEAESEATERMLNLMKKTQDYN